MPTTYKNRLRCAVSAVASSGLGAWTVSTAASGAVTFAAGDDGKTFTVLAVEGASWEVRTGCVYTHSGTSLSRGALESSSTGSAITFTTACVLDATVSADELSQFARAMQAVMPGGRLTLESGVPVSTTDQTAKTTIYYTPYVHDTIPLWDGSRWVPTTFTETSEALGTLTSGLPYDVFGFLSSGVLDLEKLAWTNGTTRATAVTLQDGRYCKSGDKTRLLLGTFYTTSTTTTEDSGGGTTTQVGGKRFVSNVYNRVLRPMSVIDTTDSWSYTTNTVRQANGGAGNKVEFVNALDFAVNARVLGVVALASNSTRAAKIGVGLDSTTAFTGLVQGGYKVGTEIVYAPLGGSYIGHPGVGYHYLAWLEKGADGTSTFNGDNTGDGQQTGLIAEVWA